MGGTSLRLPFVSVSLIFVLTSFSGCTSRPPIEGLPEPLQLTLNGKRSPALIGPLKHPATVRAFYKERQYEPAWLSGAKPSEQGRDLLQAVESASWHGLQPAWYHLNRLEELVDKGAKKALDQEALVEWELLATDTFVGLASDLAHGRVDPHDLQHDWALDRAKFDSAKALKEALAGGGVKRALEALRPSKEYEALQEALHTYVQIQKKGGWTRIAPGPKLHLQDFGARVKQLKQRLGHPNVDDKFDARLEERVKDFQTSVGLKADGTVGPGTLTALNVPIENRIRQIEVNLERLRWLAQPPKNSYVLVNIADFRLTVFKDGEPELEMKVIVGEDEWETPVFSDEISYIVVNPDWSVPTTIAVKELLPKIKKDKSVLAKKQIDVYPRGAQGSTPPLNPDDIDWNKLSLENFPYRLIQRPGPKNPLGFIKFMFPNQFSVYLHGTPSAGLFERDVRSFSHGCIRVEKPWELAEYLLKENEKAPDREVLEGLLKKEKPTEIALKQPIPVHLFYRTAWVERGDTVEFRRDIYGWDRLVDVALQRGTTPTLAD